MSSERPYHHTADGRFRNPPGSPARTTRLHNMARFLWRQARNNGVVRALPDGHVLPTDQALAGLAALNGGNGVTWLGHAAFLIRIAGKTVLTDPYLSPVAGPGRFGPRRYAPPGIPVDRLPPIDVLVVSHNHYDHLDEVTLKALPDKDRIEVVVPLRLGDFFRRRGFTRVHELDWYDDVGFDGVTVTALPAVHFSRRGAFDLNRTLWAAFAIASADTRVFFGGDTAYGQVFREIGARVGPFDLGIIGIGAYLPREIMKASHATPEEAVQIARDLDAHAVLGMHWGTVVLTEEAPFEPPARLRRAAAAAGLDDDQVWLLAIGETRPLPQGWPANR